MEKILTILIPTYNMEHYLPCCLDSLLISEGLEKVEVLVVNDGSKDASSDIAHRYESKYPQAFRVIDKQNGNYGSCINRGLKEAVGKYVKVLDADDSFDTEHFSQFVKFLMKTDADLILSDFYVVDLNRAVRKTIRYDFGKEILFDMTAICATKTFKYMQMHAVTYRRRMLLSMGYKQTEGISYTDQQWIFIPMIKVEKVARFCRPIYKYLIGRKGQTVNPALKQKSLSQTTCCALGMVEAYEQHKSEVNELAKSEYLYARMIPIVKGVYVDAWQWYNQDVQTVLQEFDDRLHELSPEVYGYIAKPEVSSFMGFEYISYWRRHSDMHPFVVKLFSRAYVMLHSLRKSMHKEDEMAVPASF